MDSSRMQTGRPLLWVWQEGGRKEGDGRTVVGQRAGQETIDKGDCLFRMIFRVGRRDCGFGVLVEEAVDCL